MNAVRVESASHWYTPEGFPCHEVLRADGDGMRPTTLADARKLHLLPSVTNVMSVLRKPYLDAWRIEQYLDALAQVHEWNMPAEERIAAAVELAEQLMAAPRDLGSTYHQVIASIVRMVDFGEMPEVPPDTVSWRTIGAFCQWYDRHCKATSRPEMPFACALGYGGTIDWQGSFTEDDNTPPKFAVLDWKSQSTKENKPMRYYQDWACQLAAYAYGVGKPSALLVNVVISTTEPGRIGWQMWDEDAEYWFDVFQQIYAIWRGPLGKNFDPREA